PPGYAGARLRAGAFPPARDAAPHRPSLAGSSCHLCARIRAEHLQRGAGLADLGERGGDRSVALVPVDIDEEDVLPRPPPRRPALDLGQVERALRQRLQPAVEDPGPVAGPPGERGAV